MVLGSQRQCEGMINKDMYYSPGANFVSGIFPFYKMVQTWIFIYSSTAGVKSDVEFNFCYSTLGVYIP